MSNIAVTGATGFIGAAVVADITAHGHHVTALTRGANPQPDTVSIQWHSNTDYASPAAMTRAIAGTDYVIHLADDATRNGDHNSEAALAVARALSLAMQANGQKQLIFASSIYARMGTAYGNKKKVVEDFFLKETDVEPIILRLPPVYGPGCGGGFAVLSGLLRRGLPLPFGNATALRAYICPPYRHNTRVAGTLVFRTAKPFVARRRTDWQTKCRRSGTFTSGNYGQRKTTANSRVASR